MLVRRTTTLRPAELCSVVRVIGVASALDCDCFTPWRSMHQGDGLAAQVLLRFGQHVDQDVEMRLQQPGAEGAELGVDIP